MAQSSSEAHAALANLISNIAQPSVLPEPRSGRSEAIQLWKELPDGFVAPDVVPADELNSGSTGTDSAAVYLVTAPAAVGKSYLARAISYLTSNPVWDLSEFRVGSNFFNGTLATTYGGAGYAKFEALVRDGSACLIVDAADEALVRAGYSNFEAALEDLASLVGPEARGRPGVIILGRPETIETCAVKLAELDIPWAAWRVDYYDEIRAREFIEKKTGASALPDLQQFVDVFFEATVEALGKNWDDARSFVGYAPVLDAVARFYAEAENPYATLQRVLNSSSKYIWALLRDISGSVLIREAEKLAKSFGERVGTERYLIAEQSFTAAVQISSLLSIDASHRPALDLPATTPADWRDELEETARRQMADHPFRVGSGVAASASNPLARFSSVVFRDYSVMHVLQNGSPEEVALLYGYLSDPSVNPSPLLCRFAFPPDASSGSVRLGVAALGAIVNSASTSYWDSRLRITASEPSDSAADAEESQEVHDEVLLRLELNELALLQGTIELVGAPFSPLRLDRFATRLSLDAPSSSLIIGSGQRDFVLGPDVQLSVSALSSECDDVRVSAGTQGKGIGVVLRAHSLKGTTRRVIARGGAETLMVVAPGLGFPWRQFAREPKKEDLASDYQRLLIADAAMTVRRYVLWYLNRSMTGRLRYPKAAMDTIIARGRASESVHKFLFENNFLSVDGHEYVLSEPARIASIRQNNLLDQEYQALLLKYLEWYWV